MMRDTSGISSRFGRAKRTVLKVGRATQCHFLVATVILGFLSIFNNSQASSPFQAFISACLLRSQITMRPPVLMRWGPRAFSWVSTVVSDIPLSCEIKDEPAFKPLQGNPAFFRVRVSWCPLHLSQQTQCTSHIPIAEGKLHLRCLWKTGSPLQSKTGNQVSSWDDMGFMELSSSCCTDINIDSYLRRVSQGISGVA